MNSVAVIAMFGWIPLSLVLFRFMRPARAAVVALVGGWLFLPQAVFIFDGLPDYSRFTAVSFGALLGALFFDTRRLRLSPGWFDVPILIWCICPIASSLSNDLGLYDGLSGTFKHAVVYGIPYYLGRVYFADRHGIRELAVGVVIGAIVYVPFVLFESQFSPVLHAHIYGEHPASPATFFRWGGYRPQVFLSHGIELGVWLASATVVGVWTWHTGCLRRLWRIPMGWLAVGLIVVTLLCRALNGWVLVVGQLTALFATERLQHKVVLIALLAIAPVYVGGRIVGWRPDGLISQLEKVNEERARSLAFRVGHEVLLVDRARERWGLGWGAWGGNTVVGPLPVGLGEESIAESLWIISFGQRGLLGLLSVGMFLLLGPVLLVKRLRASEWSTSEHAPACALATVLVGFVIDCLANAMLNPVYFVIAGALMRYEASDREADLPVDSMVALSQNLDNNSELGGR